MCGAAQLRSGHSARVLIVPECGGWRFIALSVYLECVTMLTKTLPSALSIWVPGAVIQVRVNVHIFVWQQISALSAGMLLFLKTVLQAVSNFLLIIIFLLPSMQ